MKLDGYVRIGTILDLGGLKKGLSKAKTTLSSVVGGLAKSLGGALSGLLVGAVATGLFILNKAIEKTNGETGQLKANLSYIGFVGSKVFENLLTPSIDKTTSGVNSLVEALYKVVVYIGWILEALTGRNNLFEGTSVQDYANAMEKANKSANGTAKSTAKIKKDLMSFDEINKLSDNTSGSGGGITMPNLPNLGDIKKPWWIKWIEDNSNLVKKFLEGVAVGLLAVKGGLSAIQGAGLFLIIDGFVDLKKSIEDWKTEKTVDNLTNIAKALGEIAVGIGLVLGLGTPLGLFFAIFGQGISIIGGVVQQVKNLVEWFKDPSWDNFRKVIKGAIDSTGILGQKLSPLVDNFLKSKKAFEDLYNTIMTKLTKIGVWFVSNVYPVISRIFSNKVGGLGYVFKALINSIIDGINRVIQGLNNVLSIKIPSWVPTYGGKSWSVDIPKISRLAHGGIINNPGKGVPLGTNIIGGERGREAVIPLNDETMDRLGSSIAKHMSVNLTNINQMNGRVISRELKQISNENDFSYNG